MNNYPCSIKGISAKPCVICGKLIIFKFLELFEKENPHDYLHWKWVLVKPWWCSFDADNPKQKHEHRKPEALMA